MSGTVPPSGKATVDALADHWAKLFATYLYREGIKDVVFSAEDFERITADATQPTIVVQELQDGLHVKILPIDEALKLAKQYKGGFGQS